MSRAICLCSPGAAYWFMAHNDAARGLDLAQKAIALEPRYSWRRSLWRAPWLPTSGRCKQNAGCGLRDSTVVFPHSITSWRASCVSRFVR